jgi:hypothetical protein
MIIEGTAGKVAAKAVGLIAGRLALELKDKLALKSAIGLIDKQKANDRAGGINRAPSEYDEMLDCLAELSLTLLRKGIKEKFRKQEVREFRTYLTLMQKTQMLNMVKHVLDVESERWYREDAYSYHHPNFQEYFAVRQLVDLAGRQDRRELFESLADMKYEPEVGRFLCELVEKHADAKETGVIFRFWQDLLFPLLIVASRISTAFTLSPGAKCAYLWVILISL